MSNTMRSEVLSDFGNVLDSPRLPRLVALLNLEAAGVDIQEVLADAYEIDLRQPEDRAVQAETDHLNRLNEAALRTDTTRADGAVHTLYFTALGAAHVV